MGMGLRRLPSRVHKTRAPSVVASKRGAWRNRLTGRIAEIADKTSNQTKQATKIGLARASEYGRDNVLPEIERTGAKLKEHARPEQMKKDYRNFLHWLHERVLDPPKEQLFFVPTKDPVALAGLTVRGANKAHGHDYRPSPCQLFAVDTRRPSTTISRGSPSSITAPAQGRVLLLASEHPFAAIGGIEFASELHDNAVMNIAQYPRSRMRCRNVECVLEDASQVGPPDGEAIHYFFNPFSREVFAEVLHNLVVSYRKKPRRLYLILVDPVATDLVDDSGVFQRMELPMAGAAEDAAAQPLRGCALPLARLSASLHAELLLQVRRRGGVLEDQLLIRIDVFVDLLRHERALVEARQDQLQLARIGIDVADGEDALLARLELLRVDGNQVLFEIEPPIGDRAELHGEAEERQHDFERLLEGRRRRALHRRRGELAVVAMQRRHLTELEGDVAALRRAPASSAPRPARRGTPSAGAAASATWRRAEDSRSSRARNCHRRR